MNKLLTLFLFLTYGICSGQNLVPNPSFEIYTSCPTSASEIYKAIPWQGVTTNSSDYFHVCGTGLTSIPNFANYQYPRSGNAFAGIWAVNGYGSSYREYIRVQLDSVLQSDSCYLVEFYCNINGYCKWAVDKIGAYLSSDAINTVGPNLVLQNIPQIESHVFLADTLNWMRVGGYYQASGGEKYITIGNFSTDNVTDTLGVGGNYPGSYYFIDDVKIEKIVGCDTTSISNGISENKKSSIILYPNPITHNKLNVQVDNYELTELIIYDYSSRKQIQQTFTKSTTVNSEQLAKGMYFYTLRNKNGIIMAGKVFKE